MATAVAIAKKMIVATSQKAERLSVMDLYPGREERGFCDEPGATHPRSML